MNSPLKTEIHILKFSQFQIFYPNLVYKTLLYESNNFPYIKDWYEYLHLAGDVGELERVPVGPGDDCRAGQLALLIRSLLNLEHEQNITNLSNVKFARNPSKNMVYMYGSVYIFIFIYVYIYIYIYIFKQNFC